MLRKLALICAVVVVLLFPRPPRLRVMGMAVMAVMGTVVMVIGTVVMVIGMVAMVIGVVVMRIGVVDTGGSSMGRLVGPKRRHRYRRLLRTSLLGPVLWLLSLPLRLGLLVTLHRRTVGTGAVQVRLQLRLSPMSTATPIARCSNCQCSDSR